jgi:hypothetical protein
MVPFTQNNGIAFIESQGFVSEYGIALARLCNCQKQISKDYTGGWRLYPKVHRTPGSSNRLR